MEEFRTLLLLIETMILLYIQFSYLFINCIKYKWESIEYFPAFIIANSLSYIDPIVIIEFKVYLLLFEWKETWITILTDYLLNIDNELLRVWVVLN